MSGGDRREHRCSAPEACSASPEAVATVAPAARRAREKQMRLSPTNSGRTAQFNVKMRADLKAHIVRASRDHRLLIAELVRGRTRGALC